MDKKAADLDQKHGYKIAYLLGCSRPVAPTPSHLNTYPSTAPAMDSSVFKTAEKRLKKKAVGVGNQVSLCL